MPAGKYPSIFSRQMKAIVYITTDTEVKNPSRVARRGRGGGGGGEEYQGYLEFEQPIRERLQRYPLF